MSAFSITSYTTSSVTLYFSGMTTGNTIRVFIRLTSDSTNTTVDTSFSATGASFSKTFSGLQANTNYTVNIHDGSAWVGAKSFTTAEETSTGAFSLSYTSTTVTFSVTGLKSGKSVHFTVYADATNATVIDTYVTASSTSMTQTFSGLSGGTAYRANVHDGIAWLGTQYFTTPVPRPSNWYWSSTIATGYAISITAVEWNAFCTRINDFRKYKSLSDYSFTTVYSGTTISASIVNQAWNAINAISGHGTLPSYATVGGSITASFFNTLMSALNAIS